MANFHTHVTTSTVFGIGYAGAGMLCGVPINSCLIAGGLCGVAGMLPDIDSDNGIPVRESMAFAAAVVPMMLVGPMIVMGLSHETIILIAAGLYFFIRFVLAAMLKKWTVHRGMFHSIPAAIVFAEVAFLLACCSPLPIRFFKAGGVLLGVMSHLILDEIYSIEFKRGRLRLKRSFGTAIKFWGPSATGNLSVYVKLLIATALVLAEPMVMQQLGAPQHHDVLHTASERVEQILR